ncbi:hypothetical protein WH47_01371 [Habropoda laboriosa]|uniref:Uncharacterized protein n=1 Tax=Habropoda laboriosa TaxID=597456 RepID=A0A0L7R694_9HYME|nr:hypothetical protein WH47_01371 [Habropoda laboriosa]
MRESGVGKGVRVGSQEYSRRVYRYATPSAINISGKVDDVGRVERHSGESPEPGIYNETKKGALPSFSPLSSSSFPLTPFVLFLIPPSPSAAFYHPFHPFLSSASFSLPRPYHALLDLPDVEVHFIPTFNKAS